MTPVFLVAARRSGTTLFRLMLDGHPDVHWFRGWEPVAEALKTLSGPAPEPMEVDVEGLGPVSADSPSALRDGIEAAIATHLADHGKTMLGATVHVGFRSLPDVWPEARYIHLIRDPRDIAISNLKLAWAGHPFRAAHTWETAERDWEKIHPRLRDDQWIDVRYEDLVADPERELGRVCDFLGVPFDKGVFSYIETSAYGYPKAELAQRWRGKLDARDTRLIEYGLQDLMTARGYAPASDHRALPKLQQFIFRQISTWRLRQNAMKEHGLTHVVMRKAASVLNSKTLLAKVQAAEQEKRALHIKNLEKNY